MAFFITHMSAADFWRVVYSPHRAPNMPTAMSDAERGEASLQRLRSITPEWLSWDFTALEGGRLHLLLRDGKARRKSDGVINHVWGGPIPEGSFYRLADDVFVASPEFTFLHLASSLGLGELVAYGNEICGAYAFDPSEERGFRKRSVSLTTAEKLLSFTQAAAGAPGAQRALRALRFIGDGAESPTETTTWTLLRLLFRYGGYNQDGLAMNRDIPLTPAAARIAKRNPCRADLVLDGTNLILEYLGKHDHLGEEAFDADRRRTNALTEMGFEVIELTSDQLHDWKTFELVALRVAKKAGKRIRSQYKGPLPARMSLRKELFSWNAAYGRPGRG